MNICAQIDFVRVNPVFPAWPVSNSWFRANSVNEQESQDRDIELLRLIAASDRSAFAEFYDRHSTLMFSVACKILGNNTDAEDILQEAFLQIWEKASKFDPKLGKASSWAAILVRNKAIDRIRASQRRTRLAEEAGAEQAVVNEVNDTAKKNI